jgi:benzodiazapine receptor
MTAIASRAQLRVSLLRSILVTVPLVLLLGTVSTTMSDASGYNAWFRALAHADVAPADWVIGTVTMLSWLLLGIVLAMLLHARGARRRRLALALFVLLLLLALAWPPVLFAFHEIGASLLLLAAMSLLDVLLVGLLWRMRRLAALLMLLHLGWLGYLAALSWRLVELNPVAPQPPSTDIVL